MVSYRNLLHAKLRYTLDQILDANRSIKKGILGMQMQVGKVFAHPALVAEKRASGERAFMLGTLGNKMLNDRFV